MGEISGVYRVLVGKPEGKRPLGRPRLRWEDIKVYFQEVGCEGMDSVDLAQDRDSTREWRKLRNEEINVLYCSPNIVRVIKFEGDLWAVHAARMGEISGVYRVLVGKPGERDHLKDPGLRWEDIRIHRVSQEECEILRESVPYVKLYRYNPKHLYPKLNGYGDNGQRKVWTSCISAYCTSTAT